ncbi:MAG: hypothetical protein M1814_002103 [Vezdaea aestivalis]|nr:MAG: hypothetical protein M1814_002103 [Vezdaea aestivalis]
MATVILGSGIIGLSTAYYLSRKRDPSTIHIVDPSPKLFASASGNAAGFLARDWFAPAAAALGVLSFDLHQRLAEEHDGREKWGYSPSTSFGIVSSDGQRDDNDYDWLLLGSSRARAVHSSGVSTDEVGPVWLKMKDGKRIERNSEDGTTAQVDPLRLCEFLLGECQTRGVQLHHPAKALSVTPDIKGELACVRILSTVTGIESDIPATRIVIAAGAWSPSVFKSLFPSSGLDIGKFIGKLAGHSIVIKYPEVNNPKITGNCHAIFLNSEAGFTPEIFSRVGGEIYVAGLNCSSLTLPELPTDTILDTEAIQKLKDLAAGTIGIDDRQTELEIVKSALCFRPVTESGTPLICKIKDADLGELKTRLDGGGVYLAAGHGPWGISLSLGTGMVMANLIEGHQAVSEIRDLGLDNGKHR